MAAARAAEQVGVGEVVGLHAGRAARASVELELDRGEPRAQQGAARRRARGRPPIAPLRASPSRHHALDHPQHGAGVGRRVAVAAAERARPPAPSRRAPTWRPTPGRRGPRPGRRGGGRGTRAASPAAGASVHVRPMSTPAWSSVPRDAGAAVGVDVDRGRQVELRRAGAVADLPDREQLGEPPPVAGGQRRRDGVERVRQRARDLAARAGSRRPPRRRRRAPAATRGRRA